MEFCGFHSIREYSEAPPVGSLQKNKAIPLFQCRLLLLLFVVCYSWCLPGDSEPWCSFLLIQQNITEVQPRWIQGDSKVGGWSRRLWKNTYLITDRYRERLETDSVVGRLVEKKRLNNLDYVE